MPRRPARTSVTDDMIALCLVTVWAIRTGRQCPATPYDERTPEELETFWSDASTDEANHVRPIHASTGSHALLGKTTTFHPPSKK